MHPDVSGDRRLTGCMMNQRNMESSNNRWRQTKIWLSLEERNGPAADSVKTFLKDVMPDIERVLNQGGTSALDFTLHDSEHSFRVSERMAELVPNDVFPSLGDYELALLLLSAYLHDIGMTPERGIVLSHYRFLLAGTGELTSDQQREFQKWLDNEGQPSIPVPGSLAADARLSLAAELTTHYSRFKHNDWSEEWIRAQLQDKRLGNYAGWLSDLIRLCRSHHEGRHELLQRAFHPRLVGTPAQIVHLRYLAAVLRVADILDLDPERTPDVVLRHRDVSPGSLIYWSKDRDISLRKEANWYVVHARPDAAHIHKAIEVTLDQVDEELRLCERLAIETHFEVGPVLGERLPHRWDIRPLVARSIEPRDHSYEYIQGDFRPNTRKILKLLSGTALYEKPIVAIRELLQNAFDAVREQIAYERLARENPADPSLETDLGRLHTVRLRVEFIDGSHWLVCTDDGVGMSKAIIQGHFLVSGVSRRSDVIELERQCERAGFNLGRTGQFGIGVLSYFMLGDYLLIRTLRSQQASDPETNGWQFEIDGMESFGALRRDTSIKRGTEVRVRLKYASGRPEAVAKQIYGLILEYLKEILVRLPCVLRLDSNLPDCPPVHFDPGWLPVTEDLSKWVPEQIRAPRSDIPPGRLTKADREQAEAFDAVRSQFADQIVNAARLSPPLEGALPDGLGHFRLQLPYFELPGGESLVFVSVESVDGQFVVDFRNGEWGAVPPTRWRASWKGISVEHEIYYPPPSLVGRTIIGPVYVSIDWQSQRAGEIGVSRKAFTLSPEAHEAVAWLRRKADDLFREFIADHRGSVYHTLNLRRFGRLGFSVPASGHEYWLVVGNDPKKGAWVPVQYPLTTSDFLDQYLRGYFNDIFIAQTFGVWPGGPHSQELFRWSSPPGCPPQKVVLADVGHTRFPTVLWTEPDDRRSLSDQPHQGGWSCDFPPNWGRVVGMRVAERFSIWNPDNPLSASTPEDEQWVRNHLRDASVDPLSLRGALTTERGKGAAWIRSLLGQDGRIWNGLVERDRSFIYSVWELVFRDAVGTREVDPACFFDTKFLVVITPNG